jgi:hypothetical protein
MSGHGPNPEYYSGAAGYHLHQANRAEFWYGAHSAMVNGGTACYSARLAVPRAATTLKLGHVTGHRKEDIKRETLHCDSSSGFTSFSAGSPRDTSRRYSARFALHHQPALLGPTWSPTSTGKYLPRSRCVSHPYSDLLRSASVSVS